MRLFLSLRVLDALLRHGMTRAIFCHSGVLAARANPESMDSGSARFTARPE
jgi:hypothetical protein